MPTIAEIFREFERNWERKLAERAANLPDLVVSHPAKSQPTHVMAQRIGVDDRPGGGRV